MKSKKMVRAIAPVLIGLLFGGTATAAEQEPVTHSEAKTSVTVQGVQVAIDPRTGRLVAPTEAQRDELSRGMRQQAVSGNPRARNVAGGSAAPRTELEARATQHDVRLRNGRMATGMQVPESLMNDLLVERRPDGSLNIHHQGESDQTDTTEVVQ
jgi:hypothetical protein